MLRTIADMAPNRLHTTDIVPGRGIVADVTTTGGYIVARFTNGNEAHYRPTERLTVHRSC